MLKSKQQSQDYRHAVLEPKERSSLSRLLHKWNVGLEQEGYPRISNLIQSSQCLQKAPNTP